MILKYRILRHLSMSQQEEGCTYECVLASTQRWLSTARHLNLDTTVLKLQSWSGPVFFFFFLTALKLLYH